MRMRMRKGGGRGAEGGGARVPALKSHPEALSAQRQHASGSLLCIERCVRGREWVVGAGVGSGGGSDVSCFGVRGR